MNIYQMGIYQMDIYQMGIYQKGIYQMDIYQMDTSQMWAIISLNIKLTSDIWLCFKRQFEMRGFKK